MSLKKFIWRPILKTKNSLLFSEVRVQMYITHMKVLLKLLKSLKEMFRLFKNFYKKTKAKRAQSNSKNARILRETVLNKLEYLGKIKIKF